MARRSREEELIRAITALILLAVGVWIFVPLYRSFLIALVGLVALISLGWLVLKLNKTESPKPFEPKLDELTTISHEFSPIIKFTLTDQLRQIDWFQFEKLVALLYQSRGYSVKRLGGANPDGGVDLIVQSGTERFVIQCKQWNKWTVGVRQLREFLGTLTDSGVEKGVYVTMRGYTNEAKQFARKHGISLLDERDIILMVEEADELSASRIRAFFNDKRKFCPKCEYEMIKRTSQKGRHAGNHFWGCSKYPHCKFTMPFETYS